MFKDDTGPNMVANMVAHMLHLVRGCVYMYLVPSGLSNMSWTLLNNVLLTW